MSASAAVPPVFFEESDSNGHYRNEIQLLQDENSRLKEQLALLLGQQTSERGSAGVISINNEEKSSQRRRERRLRVSSRSQVRTIDVVSSIKTENVQYLNEIDEVANLKLKVWEEVVKSRDESLPPIELHSAPRSVQDCILELTQKECSAFNFVNLGVVVDKYLLWKRKLPRAEPFYAIKSNPDPEIARVLFALGAGFDCASRAEIEQVLDLGCSPDNIIFANPCKRPDHILYAKDHGVDMMTFDNIQELYKIREHYPDAKIVLRILPDDSYSLMPFGIKFGATFEDSCVLIEKCRELNMNLIGVSFHVGSGCFSSVAWVEALKLARRVFDEAAKFDFDLHLLDLGGGWPGTENGPLKFANIGTEITPVIDQLFPEHVRVIGEPGRFFCTETTSLAVTVVSKRERVIASGVGQEPEKEIQYYVNDGVYGSFNCIMFDHAHPEPAFLCDISERNVQQACIFGPTCDSMDVICKKIFLPDHEVGDWLYFPNMGAYTTAAASSFNGFAPPKSIYALSTQ